MENQMSFEFYKDVQNDQKEFVEGVMNYPLTDVLERAAKPLTIKERKSLKEFDVKTLGESEDELEKFVAKVLSLRKVTDKQIEEVPYPDYLMFGHRIIAISFSAREIATRKK